MRRARGTGIASGMDRVWMTAVLGRCRPPQGVAAWSRKRSRKSPSAASDLRTPRPIGEAAAGPLAPSRPRNGTHQGHLAAALDRHDRPDDALGWRSNSTERTCLASGRGARQPQLRSWGEPASGWRSLVEGVDGRRHPLAQGLGLGCERPRPDASACSRLTSSQPPPRLTRGASSAPRRSWRRSVARSSATRTQVPSACPAGASSGAYGPQARATRVRASSGR